ncbi:MAG: DNA polymerase III subunit alpha [Pseudomonadales bacterium]|nr:DNA polymerase III subunit alpha [Pseudomonadales bacterium]
MSNFVHLKVHTEFSISDGIIKVPALVERTLECNSPAIAITDKVNFFGLIKFYQYCMQSGIKPIVGVELHIAGPGDTQYQCTALAMNNQGYANLLVLVSRSYLDCPDQICVDKDLLIEMSDGLIMLSGAVKGDVGKAIVNGDVDRARDCARMWQAAFPDRFYIELQRTSRPFEETYNATAVDIANELAIPLVATNDVCFLFKEDFDAHETRVCIHAGRVLNDQSRERAYSAEQYYRSPEDMAELFSDLPQAIENTYQIALRCNVTIQLGTHFLPNYPVPGGETIDGFFSHLSHQGLEKRLVVLRTQREDWRVEDDARYFARLEFELDVISEMGFAGYFLIVMEFIQWSKDNDIPVGPGRGSGAGSLVAYSLGITGIDPLYYNLLFERFLNPERVSMPDFDIDFCMEGRDRVIAHVSEMYGQDAVSQIITFGTMAAKAVVRDVARVQGKSYGMADRIAKLIPFEVGMTLGKAEEQVDELRQLIADNEEVSEIMEMAYDLEGVVRNVGRHAGGVVIAPSKLTDFVPLYRDEGGAGLVSQFDKDDVESAGLVKFDFLGLKTLTVIDWAVRAINEKRKTQGQVDLDIDLIPLDDPDTFVLLQGAATTAIFQLESRGMRELIVRQNPECFEDIISLVALFRPGPLQSGMVDDFIDCKAGRTQVKYPHADLEPVLKETFGVILYQEQVMQIAQVLAQFTLGQADILRRAMGKKKVAEMAEQRQLFCDGAVKNGVDIDLADSIFDLMEKFAGYGFNKSHSAAYAMVSYQTAYLKTHFPAEFMAAALSVDMQNTDKIITLVDDLKNLDLELVPPCVNTGVFKFVARSNKIIFGLGAVKGVGQGPVDALVKERESGGDFKNLNEFCARLGSSGGNKRSHEALIRAGALDSLVDSSLPKHLTRAQLAYQLKDAMLGAEQSARNDAVGMTDMFGGLDEVRAPVASLPEIPPLTITELLAGEKDTLGLYLSGHPVDEYLSEIRHICPLPISELRSGKRPQLISGLVVSTRMMLSKRGDPMAFLVVEDDSAKVEAAIFPKVFDSCKENISGEGVLVMEGEVQDDDFSGGIKFVVESVYSMEEVRCKYARCIEIKATEKDLKPGFSGRLRQIVQNHKSDACGISIAYEREDACGNVVLGQNWKVAATDSLLSDLRKEFGIELVNFLYSKPGNLQLVQ